MSREGLGAAARGPSSSLSTNDSTFDEHARAVLQSVDDEVHQILDEFDGDSAENLRCLIVPAHLPVLIGTVLKVRCTTAPSFKFVF
jgi:hypothetical protein